MLGVIFQGLSINLLKIRRTKIYLDSTRFLKLHNFYSSRG